jgi:hypothetical protein
MTGLPPNSLRIGRIAVDRKREHFMVSPRVALNLRQLFKTVEKCKKTLNALRTMYAVELEAGQTVTVVAEAEAELAAAEAALAAAATAAGVTAADVTATFGLGLSMLLLGAVLVSAVGLGVGWYWANHMGDQPVQPGTAMNRPRPATPPPPVTNEFPSTQVDPVTGLPAAGEFTMELTRVHYDIEKVTGTNYSGQPRDASPEKQDDMKSITGHIPVDYAAAWDGGFGNMKGGIDFGFPGTLDVNRQANGRYTAKGRVMIKATAEWSNKGLGFGRPTGIWIRGSQELAKDDKGSFASGTISAQAQWDGTWDFVVAGNAGPGTGEWVLARAAVSIQGHQTRNTTLTAIYKIARR